MQTAFKPYKKEFDYSYAFGAFPTVELVRARPRDVVRVLVSAAWREEGGLNLADLCRQNGVELEYNDRLVARLSPKENCFVIGVFRKYGCALDRAAPQIALDNPGNMGNLGTIIRTMLGFSVKDLAIIGGGADILDPKVVRASMGAIFRINFGCYDSIERYCADCGGRDLYPFMLGGAHSLDRLSPRGDKPYTLIFGNEATGLDERYKSVGQSVVIRHAGAIDSLNLSVAVGIALYQFSKT
jgi:rRNA methylases